MPGVERVLVVAEVALGFIFLALVISYVPILYQAFSRCELRISLLDARAGSPATAVELLRRNCAGKNIEELRMLLHDWEEWCAEMLESHLSYPVLAFYRSQHEEQSWVEALTVILDTCALILTGIAIRQHEHYTAWQYIGTPLNLLKGVFAKQPSASVFLSFPVPVSMCHNVLHPVSSKSMNTRLVTSYLLPRTKERGTKHEPTTFR